MTAATDIIDPPAPVSGRPAAAPFLAVLCHGFGGNAAQLSAWAAGGATMFPQARFLVPDAPQVCPPTLRSLLGSPARRQWFPLGDISRAEPFDLARQAAHWLSGLVDAELARHGLGPDAVWFVGFSQGAMVSLLAGLGRAVAPLGICAVAGALLAPEDFVPACRPPVLLVHGTADSVVPAARSEAAADRLRMAGISVRLALLPGLDHGIIGEAGPLVGAFIAEHLR